MTGQFSVHIYTCSASALAGRLADAAFQEEPLRLSSEMGIMVIAIAK